MSTIIWKVLREVKKGYKEEHIRWKEGILLYIEKGVERNLEREVSNKLVPKIKPANSVE